MKFLKELAILIIVIVYFVSCVVTLLYLNVLIEYPVVAFISAIFGICGGCVTLSLFITKFRSLQRKMSWYKSSSIFLGNVFFLLGFVTLVPIFYIVNLLKSQQLFIGTIWEGTIFFLIVISIILAIINRKNESKV
jgi:hypothetical protein